MNDKELIKQKIRKAVERNPYKKDIKRVSIFGSYVNSVPRKDSDIDILIEFTSSARIGFFGLAQIKRDLQSFAKKPVDLLTPDALSKFFRKEVIKQSETIYEK